MYPTLISVPYIKPGSDTSEVTTVPVAFNSSDAFFMMESGSATGRSPANSHTNIPAKPSAFK